MFDDDNVIAALMPSGVEHTDDGARESIFLEVIAALMPSGVEHALVPVLQKMATG